MLQINNNKNAKTKLPKDDFIPLSHVILLLLLLWGWLMKLLSSPEERGLALPLFLELPLLLLVTLRPSSSYPGPWTLADWM